MSTRRERLERKLTQRMKWKESRDRKALEAHKTADTLADAIPFGQPILVGHHSEKMHRRHVSRIHDAMDRAVESGKMAEHHRSKAAGLESQLDNSIFSDDPDAVQQLSERIAELESQRKTMKASNAAFRKGVSAWAEHLQIPIDQAQAMHDEIMSGYSWCRQPHPSYALTNIGSNIRRLKGRLKDVALRQQHARAAESSESGVSIVGNEYVVVTFAEKPDREVLNRLKAAGFRWSGGSWRGRRDNLPEEIA